VKNIRQSAVVSLLAIATSLASAGCEWVLLGVALDDDDDEPCDCCDDECFDDECFDGECFDPPPPSAPPVVQISIADWPPIGPNGVVTVSASADQGLSRADFFFKNTYTATFQGVSFSGETATASGSNLGEGFGQLDVAVYALDGAFTKSVVQDLLVDLTPPEAYFDQTVLPATGADLTFWMADAWVVSGCELTVGSAILSEQLEQGYPTTLGVEWDFSLVSFAVEQIPVGNHAALLRVWDAAGNEALYDVPIAIDGVPPDVDILEPAEGEVVEETFVVTASASDDMPFATSIEIRVGGALIATGTAPEASFVLSSLDFPVGQTEITALAVDEAGNSSAISTRTVTIAGPEAEP